MTATKPPLFTAPFCQHSNSLSLKVAFHSTLSQSKPELPFPLLILITLVMTFLLLPSAHTSSGVIVPRAATRLDPAKNK